MIERARAVWARTRIHVWPERYRLASLPLSLRAEAARLLGEQSDGFSVLLVERDEVSLTIQEDVWTASPLRVQTTLRDGPYRVLTLDVDIPLDVSGYLAPAALRLAEAGVPIVPQCAFLKDHLLIREEHLERAVQVLEALISECRATPGPL